MAAKECVVVQADNRIGAKVGDRVVIEAASAQVFSAILLVYALPVLLFFTGYFLGARFFSAGSLVGVLGFFLGLLTAVFVSHRKTKTGKEIRFHIVSFAE